MNHFCLIIPWQLHLVTVSTNIAKAMEMKLHCPLQQFDVHCHGLFHPLHDDLYMFSKIKQIILLMHTLAHNISMAVTLSVYSSIGASYIIISFATHPAALKALLETYAKRMIYSKATHTHRNIHLLCGYLSIDVHREDPLGDATSSKIEVLK